MAETETKTKTKIKTTKPAAKPRANNNLTNFKKLVRKAIFLEKNEEEQFNAIPNSIWERIFNENFGGKLSYAQRVLLKKYKDIEAIDTAEMDREKKKIHNLDKVTKIIDKAIKDKEKIFFITDFDNDGSMAQAIINEYLNVDAEAKEVMELHYAQTINGNSSRGFTVDLIEKIAETRGVGKNDSFTVITADNGINSLEEQKKSQAMFPNMKLIVTDHHELEEGMTIEENDKVTIFNPHYKANEFFQKWNISGASTINTVLQNLIDLRIDGQVLLEKRLNIRNMNKIAKVSNVLDYVYSHPADKPEKDYVVSRFLELQPLLNINNSITKLITGEVPATALQAILKKIPNLDVDVITEEAKNIRLQNKNARIWLKIYNEFKDVPPEKLPEDVNLVFLQELHDLNNYLEENQDIDENYIGQLRPKIFNLTADDEKLPFFDELNSRMIEVFERIRESEKKMSNELRKGEVITKTRLPNSVIAYADKHILSVFNRKFLNKVYNDENPGFTLTLDSVDGTRVSGSFRSLYDISDIFPGKKKKELEKELNVRIETPGHQRAAGFIVTAMKEPDKIVEVVNPKTGKVTKKKVPGELSKITPEKIDRINHVINDSIEELKLKQTSDQREYILTDMASIGFIDRINASVRGNVAHFERITPLIKLDKDTIWTDSYTTEQYSLEEVCKNRKYGYITINANFHGDTTIVPVEVVRRIVENGYKDYLQLNYMDGGVFMTERVIEESLVKNVVDLRKQETQEILIDETFKKHFSNGSFKIELTREQIKDNPFFKYHDFGELNFELFETMVIRIIDSNKVDKLAVFDVEANGFGNARLMNFGATNYQINPESGEVMDSSDFIAQYFVTPRHEAYILTPEEIKELKEITNEEWENLSMAEGQEVLFNTDEAGIQKYFLPPKDNRVNIRNKMRLPYKQVKNHIFTTSGHVIFNREIKADMLAFLVKEKDFKTSQEITNLTGISQKLLDKYGVTNAEVDKQLAEYYGTDEGKYLFGAHNTPYDAKIARANLPKFYRIMKKNHIYDSALFSKELKLAYDENATVRFENVPGIPKNVIFNHNPNSDFNIVDIIKEGKDAYFPDRTNRYLFEITNNEFYLVDKEEHDKVKIQSNSLAVVKNLQMDHLFEISKDGLQLLPKNLQINFSPRFDPNKETEKVLKTLENNTEDLHHTIYEYNGNPADPKVKTPRYYLVETEYEDFEDAYLTVDEPERKTKYTLVEIHPQAKNNRATPLFTGAKELLNSMRIGSLPGTSIKYSVEKLSEQWMIRALNLNDETFKIEKVDLSKRKYKSLQKHHDALQYFQESYHFDASLTSNVTKFLSYYYSHYNDNFFTVDKDGNNDSSQHKAFKAFTDEFLKKNKKIQQKFHDSWIYKAVLSVHEPRRGNPITNDLIDLVNYQTNVPEHKIRKIFKEALAFKDKYNLDHIIQHELHVNGLFEGDKKGDVLFEDKLTLSLLAQRQYDSYEHNIEYGVNTFNAYQVNARKAFDLSDLLSDEIANDSYSFRQGLTYDRSNKTPMIKNIQKRERDALDTEYDSFIKFKLNNDVLAQDQSVYAVPKEGVEITRDDVEDDKERLSFIMMTIQIANGLRTLAKKKPEAAFFMRNVLKENYIKAVEHKEELAKRYRFIHYSKKDFNIKESINTLIDGLTGSNGIAIKVSEGKEPGTKEFTVIGRADATLPLEDVDAKGISIIQSVVRKYVANHKRLTNSSFEFEAEVMEYVDRLDRDYVETPLEMAIADPDIEFSNFSSISEPNFLPKVETKKLNPIKTFFSKTPELRLGNEFIANQIKNAENLTEEGKKIWAEMTNEMLLAHIVSGNSIADISAGELPKDNWKSILEGIDDEDSEDNDNDNENGDKPKPKKTRKP